MTPAGNDGSAPRSIRFIWPSPLSPPLLVCAALLALVCASSQGAPARSNRVYPGELTLQVDLTNPQQRIFRVEERIPTSTGPLLLYYPKWIPGEHSPSGPIGSVTGLIIRGDGQTPIEWRRDLEDMYALHVNVPAGVHYLMLQFQILSPGAGGAFGQSVSTTDSLEDLEWNQVVFYPAGFAAPNISVRPAVKVPAPWKFSTALAIASADGDVTTFEAVSLEQLIDSPLVTGLHFARLDLAPGADVPVHLDLIADEAADLKVTDSQLTAHRNLVRQAVAIFGSQHYGHYDFLFTLSESTGHFGLEHSQSSDDRLWAKFFTDPDAYLAGGALLPHEYVHSWNGKFRRPAGLATPNYDVPMHDDLLWVYEGLTDYLGEVLAARSGIWTADQYRDMLAMTAAAMEHRTGRQWRNLQDTADAAQVTATQGDDYVTWRRSADYYPEGALIWLDVDTTIRELSAGRRSLDDFLRAFYGMDNGSFVVKPYTFEDVVNALRTAQPNDWSAFLKSRLNTHAAEAPLGGLTRGGWRLVYTDTPSPIYKARDKIRKSVDLSYSLGLILNTSAQDAGNIVNVAWNSPAFVAGLAPGMKLLAIDGHAFDAERIDADLQAAKNSTKPIELLVKHFDRFDTIKVDYHQGPRYPHLSRIEGTTDRLSDVVAAK